MVRSNEEVIEQFVGDKIMESVNEVKPVHKTEKPVIDHDLLLIYLASFIQQMLGLDREP